MCSYFSGAYIYLRECFKVCLGREKPGLGFSRNLKPGQVLKFFIDRYCMEELDELSSGGVLSRFEEVVARGYFFRCE